MASITITVADADVPRITAALGDTPVDVYLASVLQGVVTNHEAAQVTVDPIDVTTRTRGITAPSTPVAEPAAAPKRRGRPRKVRT